MKWARFIESVYFPGKYGCRVEFPLSKKNEKGELVEYAAVLFEYIPTDSAMELYNRINKKKFR